MTVALGERFWAKVAVRGPDDCWEWRAATDSWGYGHISVVGKLRKAHRVAYELAVGPIPDGLVVCHTCDNPPCCNPVHLFPGTVADNNADMVAKKRHAHGLPGEANPRARLTWSDVEAIRALYGRGSLSQQALAERFGVSRSAIGDIVRGQHWQDPVYPPRQFPERLAARARLTPREVSRIRERYAGGGTTQEQLGREYGVTKGAISAIVNGKRWRAA